MTDREPTEQELRHALDELLTAVSDENRRRVLWGAVRGAVEAVEGNSTAPAGSLPDDAAMDVLARLLPDPESMLPTIQRSIAYRRLQRAIDSRPIEEHAALIDAARERLFTDPQEYARDCRSTTRPTPDR